MILLKSIKESVKKSLRLFKMVAAANPRRFWLANLFFMIDGGLFAAGIYVFSKVFETVSKLPGGASSLKELMIGLLLLGVMKVLHEVISGVDMFLGETYDTIAKEHLTKKLNEITFKRNALDFEDVHLLEEVEKAYEGIRHAIRYVNVLNDVFLYYLPQYLFLGIYLYSLSPVLAFVLPMIFIPVVLAQMLRVRQYAHLEDQVSPLRRKAKHYEDAICQKSMAKETRGLGASIYFIAKMKDALKGMKQVKWNTDLKSAKVQAAGKLITLIGYGGVLWLAYHELTIGRIGVGAFAAVLAATDDMFASFESLVIWRFGSAAKNLGQVTHLLNAFKTPIRYKSDESMEAISRLTFEKVGFSYPNSNGFALENVSLTIRAGEKIAVVGENGSGKTTLTKLLSGVYLPTTGAVLHNDLKTESIHNHCYVTVVGQNYARYPMTLKENLELGSLKGVSMSDINELHLERYGIDCISTTLENGLDTLLSKELGGTDLSGGQWQRVAIARAMNRESQIIILDEPTSAIDPIEEARLYDMFFDSIGGKTAIIVTHRLASVKRADKVLVIKEGRVVGFDRHERLLEDNIYYRTLWKAQAEQYQVS
ncbi:MULTISPECIES: ABC transporter ATP-binding protein [unclassified Fusibacter]|uniref:ATP-binding cassette domain-containing protein n=1 Tax=unclassified Fusibacter TaxID=2624464 RepID=UPI0010117005|nr:MULTISPECIES: ABC transporter ATP-binding protein [unclassified Fusibacter]MCK8059264.1 ABC transporter ATP-binding protein/permease [Fusibacter sp. A2]NPE21272.1 ABC transporter ATP-binding protein [Fusibacter sp. A1]RXV62537.1 ABC transporter ATP-binding protein [Fusibacter sp. A1]